MEPYKILKQEEAKKHTVVDKEYMRITNKMVKHIQDVITDEQFPKNI